MTYSNGSVKNWLLILTIVAWWAAISSFSATAPGLDGIEELVWASSFEWAYLKHPPLPTWVLLPAVRLFGKSPSLTFVMAFLCVGISSCIMMQLLRLILQQTQSVENAGQVALLGTLAVSPIAYYTFLGWEYNHNTVQLVPLTGMFYWYYKTWLDERSGKNLLRRSWIKNWTVLGFCGAMAILTKYSGLIQIAVLGLHFFYTRRWRSAKALKGVFFAMLVAVLLLIPHPYGMLISHTSQDPIDYLLQSLSPNETNWLFEFTHLLVTQSLRLLPAIILVWMWIWILRAQPKKVNDPVNHPKSYWVNLNHQDKTFLWFCILGPITIAILVGFLLNINIKGDWATTFYLGAGALAWKVICQTWNTRRAVMIALIFHIGLGFSFYLIRTVIHDFYHHASRSNYPAQLIAENIFKQLHQHYPQIPIRLVAGDIWTAGNIAIWGDDSGRAMDVWVDAEDLKSPWLLSSSRRHNPFLVVIDRSLKRRSTASPAVKKLYGLAQIKGTVEVPWARNQTLQNTNKVIIDWAISVPDRP